MQMDSFYTTSQVSGVLHREMTVPRFTLPPMGDVWLPTSITEEILRLLSPYFLLPSSSFHSFHPSFSTPLLKTTHTRTRRSPLSLSQSVGRSVGGRPQLSLAPRQLLRPLPPRSKRRRQLPIYGIAETLLLASHDGRRILSPKIFGGACLTVWNRVSAPVYFAWVIFSL